MNTLKRSYEKIREYWDIEGSITSKDNALELYQEYLKNKGDFLVINGRPWSHCIELTLEDFENCIKFLQECAEAVGIEDLKRLYVY